ncbi:MAG: head GIN domain-containing protein [Cyclobacteriaceae bacterium]
MKKLLMVMSIGLISLSSYGQQKETRNLGSFDYVAVGESIDLILIPGSEEKAVIEVKGADPDDVETKISGGKLTIGMANGSYRNVTVKATVTFKSMEGLSVSSSATAVTNGKIKANNFKLSVSSSGSADIELDAEDLEVRVSSSGRADVRGSGNDMAVNISSSGEFNGYDYKSENADVSVSSSGSAKVMVTENLDARANSSGKVVYRGTPGKVKVSANSSGKVVKG